MTNRKPDPIMDDEVSELKENDLKTYLAVLRDRHRNQERELDRLKAAKPFGKKLLRMLTTAVISLLMLFAGLLYTYAINKLTGNPPDEGANTLLDFAIWIYLISIVLQIINAGGS